MARSDFKHRNLSTIPLGLFQDYKPNPKYCTFCGKLGITEKNAQTKHHHVSNVQENIILLNAQVQTINATTVVANIRLLINNVQCTNIIN